MYVIPCFAFVSPTARGATVLRKPGELGDAIPKQYSLQPGAPYTPILYTR